MNVRVWRHHREDHAGLIREAFLRRGATVTEELVGSNAAPSGVDGVDVLVILGSSESVYDPSVDWIEREMTVLRSALESGVRIFGICFGAQMLCVATGGAVSAAPNGELGWVLVDSRVSGLVEGPWFQYHNDWCQPHDSAVIVASNAAAIQAFAVGGHLGVQFHPEVDASQLEDWFAHDTDAQRRGADVPSYLAYATANATELQRRADQLVGHFLGELT